MTREEFFKSLQMLPLSYKLFNKIIASYLNNLDKVTCKFNISAMNYEFSLGKSMIKITSFNKKAVSFFFYPDVSKPYITSGIIAYANTSTDNANTEEENLYNGCTALIDFANCFLKDGPRIEEFQNLTIKFINEYTGEDDLE